MAEGKAFDSLIGTEIDTVAGNALVDSGVAFDGLKQEARQAEISGLANRYNDDPAKLVEELNHRLCGEWYDDFGISYTHLAGRDLRGLELHGVAERAALSANDLRGANFEGARLNAALFTVSLLDGVRARGADFGNVVAPGTSWRGADLRYVAAADASFNMATFDASTQFRGADMPNAYLIGAKGLTAANLRDVASIVAARTAQSTTELGAISETLAAALASRFTEIDADALRDLHEAKFLAGLNLANKLLGSRRLDGAIMYDAVLTGARLTGSDATAGIWSEVQGRAATLSAIKAAGLVLVHSGLVNADIRSGWLPGALVVESNLNGADLSRANLGGSVFIDTDLEKTSLAGANMDGAIIIGDKTPELEAIQQAGARIINFSELPMAVASGLAGFSKQISGSTSRPALR